MPQQYVDQLLASRGRVTGERRVIGRGRIQMEARRKSGEHFPVELSIATILFVRFVAHDDIRPCAVGADEVARDDVALHPDAGRAGQLHPVGAGDQGVEGHQRLPRCSHSGDSGWPSPAKGSRKKNRWWS